MDTIIVMRRKYRRWILVLCALAFLGGIAVSCLIDVAGYGLRSIRNAAFGATIAIPLVGMLWIGFVAIPRYRSRLFGKRLAYCPDTICHDIDPCGNFPAPLILDLAKGLAGVYRIPVGKLRATDRFDEDLSLARGLFFDYADDDRFVWAESRIGEFINQVPLASLPTVGEFIRAMAEAIALRENA